MRKEKGEKKMKRKKERKKERDKRREYVMIKESKRKVKKR